MNKAADTCEANRTQPGISAWLLAARPQTLSAALVPVAVGTATAASEGRFALWPALAALVSAMFIQIGTNFANDLFDFQKGADNEERIGPVRATQSGLITPTQMRSAIGLVFGLAFVVGLYLVFVGGWPILTVGILAILSGLAYTGGPYPLGYHGLGDLFVFIFFGLVAVTGTYYVQALHFSWRAFAFSVPVGLLATAVLIANNIRDIDTDCKAGKLTLAVRIGRERTRVYYACTLALAWLCLLLYWMIGLSNAWILLPWLSAPKGLALVRVVNTKIDGLSLIQALIGTARLGVLFGGLMTLGILVGGPP